MSPRTQEQNEVLRESSRARILETALELFARQGYAATSIRMITQTAGIAQGLIYNYFASKEELLATIVQESMQDVRASFAIAQQSSDPSQQIEQLIRSAFAIVREKQLFWKLQYSLRMQNSSIPGLEDVLNTSSYEIVATIEEFFRQAGVAQAQIEAAMLFGQIDGVSQHFVLNPEQYPLDAVADAMVARYRAIIAAKI
jgi:AcrR family transcriptional regulator